MDRQHAQPDAREGPEAPPGYDEALRQSRPDPFAFLDREGQDSPWDGPGHATGAGASAAAGEPPRRPGPNALDYLHPESRELHERLTGHATGAGASAAAGEPPRRSGPNALDYLHPESRELHERLTGNRGGTLPVPGNQDMARGVRMTAPPRAAGRPAADPASGAQPSESRSRRSRDAHNPAKKKRRG